MTTVHGLKDGEAGLLTRLLFRGAKAQRGMVAEPVRLMARSSRVVWAAAFFQIFFGRARRLDPRLESLASLKSAGLVGCVF